MIRSTLSTALVFASLALVPAPLGHAQDSAREEPAEACECQCAACQEKHGEVSREEAPAATLVAIATRPAAEPVPALPELSPQEEQAAEAPAAPAAPAGRGVLGVQIGSSPDGVLVTRVMEGLAAEAAGIQAGDVLFSIADRTVLDLDELREQMGKLEGGDVVSVGVIRNERPLTVTVTLGTDAQVARSTRPEAPMIARIVPSPEAPEAPARPTWTPMPVEDVEIEDVEEFEIELPTEAPPVAPSTGIAEAPAPRRIATPPPAPLPPPAIAPRVEYIEIETEVRRERRPVVIGQSNDDLRRQIEEMRAEIAELRAQIDEMQRELDRRSLR